jgi:TonB-dependent Receptor Plug Domain.
MCFRLAKRLIALAIFLTVVSQVALGQEKAKLVGKVTDKDTGEELIGASVTVVGLNVGTLTNVDGEYMLMLPPGRYDIRVSYVGYQTLVVKNVEVREGQTNRQDVQLKVEASVTEEIVVEASVSAATEGALLVQRRKSSSISDAISAEQIRRTPDSDAAEIAKRITGVSVVSGKYVYVRGLGERYSSTQLNGGTSPALNQKRKSYHLTSSLLHLSKVSQQSRTFCLTSRVTLQADW